MQHLHTQCNDELVSKFQSFNYKINETKLRIEIDREKDKREMEMKAEPWLEEDRSEEREEHEIKGSNIRSLMHKERERKRVKENNKMKKRVREGVKKEKTTSEERNI